MLPNVEQTACCPTQKCQFICIGIANYVVETFKFHAHVYGVF